LIPPIRVQETQKGEKEILKSCNVNETWIHLYLLISTVPSRKEGKNLYADTLHSKNFLDQTFMG
jgi:hypothetical protein